MLLIYSFLFNFSMAIIQKDTGFFLGFDYTATVNFTCKSQFNKTSTINFSDQFANPPQIIMSVEEVDQEKFSAQIILDIFSITTSSFQFYISCPQDQLYAYRFRWFAIDDLRIKVINQFNVTNFSNNTIPHTNLNAAAGFISLLGVGYKGPLNFYINVQTQISEITTSNVSIQIFDPQKNLQTYCSQLNYQIILTTPGAVSVIMAILLLQLTLFFLVATQGYIYPHAENIRVNVTYDSTNPIKFKYITWQNPFTQSTIKAIQLLYNFTEFRRFSCDNFRISQIYDRFATSFKAINLTLLENGVSYVSANTYSVILDYTISPINFVVTLSCQLGQKVQSSFYMYLKNLDQYQVKTQFHYCDGLNKIISYYSRFVQQMVAYQELSIVITSSSCQVSQVLYNQAKQLGPFMNITIINA